jgi:hypothetical protein
VKEEFAKLGDNFLLRLWWLRTAHKLVGRIKNGKVNIRAGSQREKGHA